MEQIPIPADLWATGKKNNEQTTKQLTLNLEPLVEVVDLFCGGGGFSQGAVQAGAKVVLAIDCWEPALKVHEANHPSTPTFNYQLGGSIVETAVFIREHLTPGAHFHLHGSPPCQALSTASKHDGEDGMVLVNWFIDLVRYMEPDSWSMENVVPVAKRLDRSRPGTPWKKLNSANFGVAQTRNRIFAGEGWEAEETHTKEDWVSVLEALPHLVGELTPAPSMVDRWADVGVNHPFPTITSQSPRQIRIVSNTDGCSDSMSRRAQSVDTDLSEPIKTIRNNSPTLRVLPPNRLVIPIQRKVGVLKANGRILQPIWREMFEPIHTITSTTNRLGSLPPEATRENPQVAKKIRSLTLDETKVLQGFPADYALPYERKRDAWVIVGNAVCPPVAEAIIRGLF